MSSRTHADGYIKWLRSHVGHDLIYLVYTTAFVFNEAGHLLVQERYDFDWLSVPGGALEMNESLSECVVRETFEETGIHCEVERLIGVFSHPRYNLLYPNGDRVQPWCAAFVCRLTGDTEIKIDGKETLQASFRPMEEIRHRLPPMYQDMLKAMETSTEPVFETIFAENELRSYYPILREKIGQERVILPGGTAVIYNDAGHVLAVHETSIQRWGLPAGFSDIGESTTATVIREVQEETGLVVEPVRVLGLYSAPHLTHTQYPHGDKVHLVDLLLECKVIGGKLRSDGHEVDSIKYMPLEELAAMADTPLRRQIYADLLSDSPPPYIR